MYTVLFMKIQPCECVSNVHLGVKLYGQMLKERNVCLRILDKVSKH